MENSFFSLKLESMFIQRICLNAAYKIKSEKVRWTHKRKMSVVRWIYLSSFSQRYTLFTVCMYFCIYASRGCLSKGGKVSASQMPLDRERGEEIDRKRKESEVIIGWWISKITNEIFQSPLLCMTFVFFRQFNAFPIKTEKF